LSFVAWLTKTFRRVGALPASVTVGPSDGSSADDSALRRSPRAGGALDLTGGERAAATWTGLGRPRRASSPLRAGRTRPQAKAMVRLVTAPLAAFQLVGRPVGPSAAPLRPSEWCVSALDTSRSRFSAETSHRSSVRASSTASS
jgi:hypothetical protein